jgi:hypothetical protein
MPLRLGAQRRPLAKAKPALFHIEAPQVHGGLHAMNGFIFLAFYT